VSTLVMHPHPNRTTHGRVPVTDRQCPQPCGSSAVGEFLRPGEFAAGTLVLRGRADAHRRGHVPLLQLTNPTQDEPWMVWTRADDSDVHDPGVLKRRWDDSPCASGSCLTLQGWRPGMSRPLLKISGGSGDILRDVRD